MTCHSIKNLSQIHVPSVKLHAYMVTEQFSNLNEFRRTKNEITRVRILLVSVMVRVRVGSMLTVIASMGYHASR